MKVSGFTFIRNAVLLDYPILEAIRSILPLCDEIVVAVGKSEDETLQLIQSLDDPRIRILHTEWDDSLRQGGRVLAIETDKALAAVSPDADWAVYIQGDEVLHEDGLPALRQAMQEALHRPEIEGLLLPYRHFYASYDYVGTDSRWYPLEVRVVRPHRGIYSWGDAQGFRIQPQRKLWVLQTTAWMHHYGWVREPAAMQRKQEKFHRLWHDDAWMKQNIPVAEAFDYQLRPSSLARYQGTHPTVMTERIARINWSFNADPSYHRLTLKDRFKQFALRYLGWDLNHRNFRRIRNS